MKRKLRHRLSGIILLLFGAMMPLPLRAEESITVLEARIAQLEMDRQERLSDRGGLILRSDQLAARVEELKREGRTKDVKAALRTSQDLTRQIEALDINLAALDVELREKRSGLEAAYEQGITDLIRRLAGAPDAAREALLEKLIRYRTAKQALDVQEKKERRATVSEEGGIEIEPQDGPEEIREKADLLADAADRLRAELSGLSARIEELGREKRIRRKMQELADEIAFFDEDLAEGRVAGQSESKVAAAPPSRVESDSETFSKGEGAPSVSMATTRSETAYRTGPEAFSIEDLDREIEGLTRRSRELSKRTAALQDKARRFYRKAREVTETSADAPSR